MTDIHDKAQVEERLWKAIDKQRTGMLGLVGEHADHFQPMTAFVEPENSQIWFFTAKTADITKAANGDKAMFVFQEKSGELQACIGGRLSQQYDRERLEKYWSPLFLNWYPDGKDDPKIAMLRFDAEDAAVWISQGGLLKLAFTTVRAAVTHEEQDNKMGGRQHLQF